MTRRHGERYERYRRETPFMLPLPKIVSKFLSASTKMILHKDMPADRREVVYVVLFYGAMLVLLSIPQTIWFYAI